MQKITQWKINHSPTSDVLLSSHYSPQTFLVHPSRIFCFLQKTILTIFYCGVITTPLVYRLYGPNDLEINFIELSWLMSRTRRKTCWIFLSQALNTSRSVALSSFFLFGGLIFVLGDWQSRPKFLTVSSLRLPLPHFIFLLCSESGINEEPFCAVPLLCSLSCLADLKCHQRGPFLPRVLFEIPLLQWCVKNSQRCWKTSDVWDSFQGIVTYLDPRGP